MINKLPFGLVLAALPLAALVACASPTASSAQESNVSGQLPSEAAPVVASSPLHAGLYQSAYSAKNDVLWVTAAVGRQPTVSALIKVNPRTREILATYAPRVLDPATGVLEAVYGVGVDDEHDRVWVTATRAGAVAVYSQSTGQHIKTFGNVAHSREVVVDEARHTAWASAFGGAAVVAYDTETLQEKRRVTVEGSGPAGLVVDPKTGTLYATDLTGNRIIVVAADGSAPRLITHEGGPISVDLSADGSTLYTADQSAGTFSVVDVNSGKVVRKVATGAGALAVRVDPKSGKALVANRGTATVSVVDVEQGTVVHSLAMNPNPNHVTLTPYGAIVLDKSGAGPDRKDTIYSVTLER